MALMLVFFAVVFVNDLFSRFDPPRANPPTPHLQEVADTSCKQPATEQNSLMTRAENEKFTLRRIEFLGLTHTPDRVVRIRMTRYGNEGDLFSRKNLLKNLQNVSKLKREIYPVTMKNVVLELKESESVVDMLICFRERRR